MNIDLENDEELIYIINQAALPTKSGALMAFPKTLHQLAPFGDLKALVTRAIGTAPAFGWGLKLPVGYAGDPHSDSTNLLIYYPHSHPSKLWYSDTFHEAVKGTCVWVPQNTSHYIERIRYEPRFSIVFAFGDIPLSSPTEPGDSL